MRLVSFFLTAMILSSPVIAAAEGTTAAVSVSTAPVAKAWHPVTAVLFLEGMVALNGVMASEIPGVYGALLTITSPLAATGKLGTAGSVAAITGTIALGQYNFNYVSNKRDAKRRRFWVTVAGLHTLPLLALGVDCLAGGPTCRPKEKTASAWRIYAVPAEEGAELMFACRF